jgi:hypothetical protein
VLAPQLGLSLFELPVPILELVVLALEIGLSLFELPELVAEPVVRAPQLGAALFELAIPIPELMVLAAELPLSVFQLPVPRLAFGLKIAHRHQRPQLWRCHQARGHFPRRLAGQ